MAAADAGLAEAIAQATALVDRSLILLGLPASQLVLAGRRAGLRTASEAFADRAYLPTGALVPRTQAGAVIDDIDTVVNRAVTMAREHKVVAVDGSPVSIEVDTICVHGDTPGAAALARRIRAALTEAGVEVAALGRV
jgi:UPF0271 protein